MLGRKPDPYGNDGLQVWLPGAAERCARVPIRKRARRQKRYSVQSDPVLHPAGGGRSLACRPVCVVSIAA